MRASAIAILVSLMAAPAIAQDYSPLSFAGSIGYDIPVNGKLHGAGVSTPVNLTTLNANLAGTGVITIRGRDYKDMYDNGVRGTLEVRYALSEMAEIFAGVSYLQAKGKRGSIGEVAITAAAGNSTADIQALFSDYKQLGLEIGYRQWLGMGLIGDRIKPYFAVRGGMVRTDAIEAQISTPTDPLANWRLYDETWHFMIGGDVGATYAISSNAELGAEVGVRYVNNLKTFDADFGPAGLGGINDGESSRLSVPVSVRLNAVF
jgi:hypothetical protein